MKMSLEDELEMWKECSHAYQWEIGDLKKPITAQRALGAANALIALSKRDYITDELAAKIRHEASELITDVGLDLDETLIGWTLDVCDADGRFRTFFEIGKHDFEALCFAADADPETACKIDLSGLKLVATKGG